MARAASLPSAYREIGLYTFSSYLDVLCSLISMQTSSEISLSRTARVMIAAHWLERIDLVEPSKPSSQLADTTEDSTDQCGN